MRLIGHLDNEEAARRLSNFLLVQGIENQVEGEAGDSWALWIHSEDQLDKAKSWLADFLKNPEAAQFKEAAAKADRLRQRQQKEQTAYAKKIKGREQMFRSFSRYGFGPVTVALIVISIGVFFLEDLGGHKEKVMPLFIANFREAAGGLVYYYGNLREILHGQVWRLFTPMFIHFDLLHIFFNLLWIRDLGGMVESHLGSLRCAVLVLVISILSNVAQFFVGGPVFGGMSGVVYGLVGYVWIRGRFDPGSGLFLHPTTVLMVLIWGLLCLVHLIPNVANTVHVVGLAVGMAWGYLASLRYR